MDIVRALAADLRDLSVDLSDDGYASTTLAMIEHNLRRSVPSVLGASITLRTPVSPGAPVVVHFVDRTITADEIGAALTLPLPGLAPPRTGSITFYAEQHDAFGSLVSRLAEALLLDPSQIDQQAPPPGTLITPGANGLDDFAVINRALGVLLHRGHTLAGARVELASRAERQKIDITAAAHALLWSTRLRTSV